MPRMHGKARAFDDCVDDGEHVGKVKIGYNSLRVEIHGKGNEIDVPRPLAVAEDGAFDPVGAGEHTQFGSGNSTACLGT